MKANQPLLLVTLIVTLLMSACSTPTPTPPTPEPPKPTTITVSPESLTLIVGKSEQLSVVVSPEEVAVTYQSKDPAIATVDAQGLVTGVAVGETTVIVQAGEATKSVPVMVEEAPIQVPQELPMLKFGIPRNDYERIEDAEVIAYEGKLGRTQQEVDFRPSGFYGEGLTTIPAVVYAIPIADDADLILAYSKESVADCKRTKAMLYQLGFGQVEEAEVSNYLGDVKKGLRATLKNDPSVTVSMMDMPNEELGTIMFMEFAKRVNSNPLVQAKHEILPDAKDFPSLDALRTKDIEQFKAFEEKLALRTYRRNESPKDTHLFFRTEVDNIEKTNLEYAFYVAPDKKADGFGLIITELLCLSSERDLRSLEFKQYLATNGFDQNYSISDDNVLDVYNAHGDRCRVTIVRLGQDDYIYQMYLFPKES
ncbi:Ig-like domain-containing protein [uncultured Porphyromonas sp.]|uniref:Ig-like domain-containing protein n=1 Tax=uncultured Porphyromonas sp. TaxID=159274 RepID=UPI00262CAE18|nr:Ig-like domain-containing protein [uncultured Porphyromonas sp.]